MAEPLFINRRTAAVLCGCSVYTLRRYDRDGKLPNRRVGDDGVVLYPAADLVAAGLLDPTSVPGGPGIDRSSNAAPTDLRRRLAEVEARNAELTARLARAEDEVAFWRDAYSRRESVA